MSKIFPRLALAALPWLVAAGLAAQTSRPSADAAARAASLIGRVTDAAGTPVSGVAVLVSPGDRRTLTDAEGEYRLEGLAARPVAVRFEVFGFNAKEAQASLAAGRAVRLDAALESSAIAVAPLTVTARRLEERVQDVPIPIAVLSGDLIERAGSFNVNRLQQSVPTIQFYTTNPRNSFLNIRGLGLPFGLANDGIEPGVGLYVDGVFHSRPAAATLDFLDVERIEVLRGPQGTLFGKNTTAGALNVTTRRPNLVKRETSVELSAGNLGYLQAKGSITGPLAHNLGARVSVSATRRDGTLHNVRTNEDVNTLDNLGVKSQLTWLPASGVVLTVAGDYTRQRPNGYAPVVAGVAPTLRAANRQFPQIAKDLGYTLPSTDPFDRLIDTDTPWRSNQDYGGASLTADWTFGPGQLTSITAWRAWNWDPSNDRDFTGLPVTTLSQAPSLQKQWTQEVRYAAKVTPDFDFVIGAFGFRQTLDGTITLESGSAAARWNLAPSANAATPGLLDGYGQAAEVDFTNSSAALFGQVQWALGPVRVLPGLRLNHDRKQGVYDQTVYGGLQTTNAALIAIQRGIYSPTAYTADVAKTDVSGQVTVALEPVRGVNTYATWATSFKSVGLNIAGGLPIIPATGLPDPSTAVVKPEDEHHLEVGIKTTPFPGVTANVTAYDTRVANYQTTVFGGDPSALRGYLANAEKVRVRGVELEGSAAVSAHFSLHGTAAYADGKNEVFTKAPASLENTGGPQFVDISGSELAGLSKWSFALGGDFARPVFGRREISAGFDASYRSSFSSSPTPSPYLRIDGYGLVNVRAGFGLGNGWQATFWSRNLLDKDYFEVLNPVGGNTGIYVGFLGDPRTFGLTLKYAPGA